MTPRRMNQVLKICSLLLLVGGVVGLYFANSRLTAIASQTSKQKAEMEVGQKQLTAYRASEKKVQSLSYVDDLASKVLPAGEDQSLVVAELSQFASRSSLDVVQISFTDKAKTTAKSSLIVPSGVVITPITIQLKAGAKYSDLLNFLKLTEQNRRKMQVTNISLAPDSKDRTKLSEVTVNLNLYSRKSTETKK